VARFASFPPGGVQKKLYDTQIIRASMQKNDGMSISYKIR
jgi:hypothetical protein